MRPTPRRRVPRDAMHRGGCQALCPEAPSVISGTSGRQPTRRSPIADHLHTRDNQAFSPSVTATPSGSHGWQESIEGGGNHVPAAGASAAFPALRASFSLASRSSSAIVVRISRHQRNGPPALSISWESTAGRSLSDGRRQALGYLCLHHSLFLHAGLLSLGQGK